MQLRTRILLGGTVLLFTVRPANAAVLLLYLDPGSASVALQVLVAALFGALFFVKMMWRRIVGLFTGKNPEPGGSSADDEHPPAANDLTK